MVQLKVYPNTDRVQSQQVFLDLYDSIPIKLTLSIEDITDADATSVFSRTFKIPANAHNTNFFTSAFEINGVDYDVTIKKPAEILVDGAEFRQGHIRLQKIYTNEDQDKTDYELLFLGETRDFSTLIGDRPLCQLDMPDLYITDAQGNITNPDKDTIQASWNAFPQTNSVDSNGFPNGGVNDGNILFPLIDFGNVYDESGVVTLPDVRVGQGNAAEKSFTSSSYPLNPTRLKPMIRAKRIWDQIFEDAGYTYSSDFIESTLFHQMYASAFGNNAQVGYSVEENSNNVFSAENTDDGTGNNAQSFGDYLWLPDNIFDPGGNFTLGVNGGGSKYVAPGTALAGDANGKYIITAEAFVFGEREISCPTFCTDPAPARLQLYNQTSGQVLKESFPTYNQTTSFSFDTELDNVGINQGDVLRIMVEPLFDTDFDLVHSVKWEVSAAPGSLNPVAQLDCEYKQIDFIKDVLKMFRLVLAPDPTRSNNFIVEPWQTYINSGDLHDWSHKLVQNKDQVLEPLFNSQSEEIEYTFQQDEDFINKFHYDQFKEAYGYLKFDSNNELLKGTRTVETIEIAPTPLGTIYEDVTANHTIPAWILPLIHANEPEDTGNQRLPIKPKTRFLFYNGLVPIPLEVGTGNQQSWYLGTQGSSNEYENYPLVSSYQNWPQTSEGLNLNWSNDVTYWSPHSSTSAFNIEGRTLFDNYWSRYISSLYGKFSRRLTAYFILNNVDLQTFSFDDTIFVNGVYYRPEKIIDVNIGERTEVKVQLITANDFVPPAYIDEQLTNFSVTTTAELCGCDGIITVTTDGATPFTWQLSNGQSGQVSTTGGNPQQFDITGICAGAYNLTITDDLGRFNTASPTVAASSQTPVTATWVVTDDTSCATGGNCNGSATVTPAGGTGPYTVYWQYGQPGPTTGPTLSGLCGNTSQTFYVEDSLGCTSDAYTVDIGCANPVTIHKLAQNINNCTQSGVNFVYAESQSSYAPGTQVDLVEIPGCYYVIGYDQGAPLYTINNVYASCADCEGVTPPQKWKIEACAGQVGSPTAAKYLLASDNASLTIGQSVEISGSPFCWEVTAIEYNTTTNETVTASYATCADCGSVQDNLYTIAGCNGFQTNAVITSIDTPQISEPDPNGIIIRPAIPTYDPNGWWQDGNSPNYTFSGFYMEQTDGTIGIRITGTARFEPGSGTVVGGPPEILGQVYLKSNPNTIFQVTFNDPLPGYTWPTVYTTNQFSFDLTYSVQTDLGLPGPHPPATWGCALTFALRNQVPGIVDEAAVNWNAGATFNLNQGSSNVMSSSGPLTITDIVKVNESGSCFEVIDIAPAGSTATYTYDENGGIFKTCIDCTGGSLQQVCHDLTASNTPTVFRYQFDDGTGNASYDVTLSAGQTDTICAQENSVVILTGAGTITPGVDECIKTAWGTSCDTQPTPLRECYTIEGVAGPGTFTSTFEWFEDNVRKVEVLLDGEIMTICADVGTPSNTFGDGNITESGTACTDITDCTLCYNYTYNGPKYEDLFFIRCDGTIGYYPDVYRVTYLNSGIVPDCIAKISGGSAVKFLTKTTTCT